MKQGSKFICAKCALIPVLGLALSPVGSARTVDKDFAPLTTWSQEQNHSVPIGQGGLAIGWFVEGGLVDGKPIDYKRVQEDDAYANQVLDQNTDPANPDVDTFSAKVVNVLYTTDDGNAVSNIPKADPGAVCFNGADIVSNHRDCQLFVDSKTGFVVYQANYRFGNSGNVEAIHVNPVTKEKATSWGNLTKSSADLFAQTFKNHFENSPKFGVQYNADKAKLIYAFTVESFIDNDVPANTMSIRVKGNVEAFVPNADDSHFDKTIEGIVKLVDDGHSAIRLELVPRH